MTEPTIDTARLRTLAKKATPGQWHLQDIDDIRGKDGALIVRFDVATDDDMQYLASLDPDTVLSLLDRLDALEQYADVRQQIEAEWWQLSDFDDKNYEALRQQLLAARHEREHFLKWGEEAMSLLQIVVQGWEKKPETVMKAIRTAISALRRAGVEWDEHHPAEQPNALDENERLRGVIREAIEMIDQWHSISFTEENVLEILRAALGEGDG